MINKLKNTFKLIYRKIKVILIFFILLVIVFVLGTVIYNHQNMSSSSNVCTTNNNQDILKADSKYIISDNIAKQQVLVKKVEKLPNYQKDPNCLYVIVNYYINISNIKMATIYYEKLKKIYNPKISFSPYLNPSKSLTDLKNDIAADQYNIKASQSGLIGMPINYKK